MAWTERIAHATVSASLSGCRLEVLVRACFAVVFQPSEHV